MRPPQLLQITTLFSAIVLIGAIRLAANTDVPFARALISYFLKQTILLVGVYVVSFNYFYYSRTRREVWIILVVLLTVIASFYLHKIMYGLNKEYGGYIGTGNEVGCVLCLSLPLVYCISETSARRRHEKTARLLIVVCAFTIVVSLSRASILALLAMVVCAAMHKYAADSLLRRHLALLTCASCCIMCGLLFPGWIDSLTTYDSLELAEISKGRTVEWALVIQYLSDARHFLIGGGTDDFLTPASREIGKPYGTHNQLLKIWVDYGLIGLVCALILYGRVLSIARSGLKSVSPRIRLLSQCVLLSMCGAIVIGSFYHIEVGSQVMSILWLQVGWLVAELELQRLRSALPLQAGPIAMSGSALHAC